MTDEHVTCPECGAELVHSDRGVVVMGGPMVALWLCLECGWTRRADVAQARRLIFSASERAAAASLIVERLGALAAGESDPRVREGLARVIVDVSKLCIFFEEVELSGDEDTVDDELDPPCEHGRDPTRCVWCASGESPEDYP